MRFPGSLFVLALSFLFFPLFPLHSTLALKITPIKPLQRKYVGSLLEQQTGARAGEVRNIPYSIPGIISHIAWIGAHANMSIGVIHVGTVQDSCGTLASLVVQRLAQICKLLLWASTLIRSRQTRVN